MVFLGDIAEIVGGKNGYRARMEGTQPLYTKADFDDDYHRMKLSTGSRTIIYYQTPPASEASALPSVRAALLSDANRGKVIYQAFAEIRLWNEAVHPLYLCYLLNCSQAVERQRQMLNQGSVIARMFAGSLKDIQIELPDLDTQAQIGTVYATAVYQAYLETQQAEQMMQGVVAILRKMEPDGTEEREAMTE